MEYQDLKPWIISLITNSPENPIARGELFKRLVRVLPEPEAEKTLRNKFGWAVRELIDDNVLVRGRCIRLQIASRLASEIAHYTKPRPKLAGRLFEEECRKTLRALSFSRVRILGKTCDRGVDGDAEFSIGAAITMKFVFQCKGGSKKVTSPQVREFVGSIPKQCAGGILFSPSGFTKEAESTAQRTSQPKVYLIGPDHIGAYYKQRYLNHQIP